MSLRPILRFGCDAAVSGGIASVLSTAVLAIASKIETGRAAAGVNGPSQWVWGVPAARPRRATLKHTALGYAIHHATSVFWAGVYEAVFCRRAAVDSMPQVWAAAAATAAVAYAVDYHMTPRRLQPGFERYVSSPSLFAVYGAFATGLVVASLLRKPRRSAVGTLAHRYR